MGKIALYLRRTKSEQNRLIEMKNKPVTIFAARRKKRIALPLYISWISAGFPSPADDYIDKRLDLNEYLIKHPAATFFLKVSGESMVRTGINHGDILIVDRAVEPGHNKIVVAVVNGEFTVKRLKKNGKKIFLIPENDGYPTIEVDADMDFEVWGVVTNVIHSLV